MPGVIMENGSRNGSHTNHDRDPRSNGTNGGGYTSEKTHDRGKTRSEPQQNMTPTSPFAPNGLNGSFTGEGQRQGASEEKMIARETQQRSTELPEEIIHITQGYIGLKDLLCRMAQKTHSDLISTITELSQMPLPPSTMNGNGSHPTSVEDNSPENINKKVRLLQFLETAHDSWTKALVIAGWSRRAEEVSKIIDLHVHLNLQKQLYLNILGQMGNDKKELMAARLLNPDLKTALEVLTTGKVSWMPDLGYLQPPPLTPKEILKTVEKLNTLLSIRLNLSEYDAIPVHFKNYTIQSGRVTFKVPGEYEVDLTIAEEDPEAQFWFIDFRFLFKPSAVALNPHVRFHIESKVNEALLKDGLIGCYKYLHELVLTHKIGEFKRQAINLARGSWVETLGVEPLNRSLCIQYWRNKHGKPSLTRSWFIMGVGSPRRQTGGPKSKATSHLFLRWFRDAKELENIELPFDTVNISTEILLKSIIAKHVAYILETTHDKLREKPLFAKRELGLSSYISLTEPAESFLKVQLTTEQTICIQIEPVTGRLVFSPASPTLTRWEHKVNRECKDLAGDAHKFIENLRFALVAEAISSRAITVGWERTAGPFLRKATLKDGLKSPSWLPADHSMAMWFRRPGWSEDWYLAAFPSMSGEHWLLIRIARAPSLEDKTSHRTHTAAHNIPADPKIINYIQLPIRAASPDPSYSFLSTLNIFAAGIVSHYANLQALHSRRCAYMLRQGNPSRAIAFPSIYIRVEDIFPSKNKSARMGREWAKNVMRLTFQGIEVVRHSPESTERTTSGPSNSPTQLSIAPVPLAGDGQRNLLVPGRAQRNDNSLMVVEARMILLDAKGITSINEQVDQNIAFNSETGSFAFRLRQKVGESVIDELVKVGVRVERLVDFVKVLRDHEKSLKCDMVSLGKIAFTYGNMTSPKEVAATNVDHETSTYKATVDFSGAEKTMMLVLEKGNPHIRILDYLTKVLNSKEGLDGVATLLPQTLPVNRGLDSISKNWPLETGPDDNEMFVNVRAADWYIIRYVIRQLSPQDSKSQPTRRHFLFEIRLRHRRGEPWWYVHRTDNSRTKEADTLDEALKPLWTSSGSGWQGMRVSGVAQKGGIQELLEKLDEVMRRFALTEETIGEAIAAQVQAAANMPRQNPAPYSRQQQQPPPQRQQLQTTNQIQSQGRGRPVKQEIVEID